MMRIGAQGLGGRNISAVGHRIVHGGTEYSAPLRLTDHIIEKLAALIPLAPLHQPHNLAPIRAIRTSHPSLPQVACFDTAFHRNQSPIAQTFAIPRKYSEAGIHRYGFHGISYEYVTKRIKTLAPQIANARLIIAHLGNGASLCAVKDGRSVASTMGFTAVDGLMMGTRCGALDPGVLIHLIDHYGLGARELEDLVYRKSGLLGVSGISSDMRTLRGSSDLAAKEAIDLFVYRIVREIGSLSAALGGLDALIFTAGIGENDAATRAQVATGCAWLGLTLDETANRQAATQISAPDSRVAAFVIPTNEELEIATSTFEITHHTA
jgi:acetate kinase